jgi:colanic acid biosynthesis glycosyl transferase WcaI
MTVSDPPVRAQPAAFPAARVLHIQVWSCHYSPEPTGNAPIIAVWAREMKARGHRIEVVAAHPHYPEHRWGAARLPYREIRDGIPVLRLPIWLGRTSTAARIREEVSFLAAQSAAMAALSRPDVLIAVSPRFTPLAPAMAFSRLRRVRWVLWLQDILPDGAATTGLLEDSALLRASRKLERAAYESADQIVVISDAFAENLKTKGVLAEKLHRIYNPATRGVPERPLERAESRDAPRLLVMGNIGTTQGLEAVVRAFESSERLARHNARLVILGTGVAEAAVRAAITTVRVSMPGLVSPEQVEHWMQAASLGLVTQRADIAEFNLPHKLMNYFSAGLPVLAVVRPGSEVARIVESSGAGWVVDAGSAEQFGVVADAALTDHDERQRRGRAGFDYARRLLTPQRHAELMEDVLLSSAPASL